MDWHRCKFLESYENLKPLVKKRFGREPNTSTAREIIACLQQGRLFYEAAEHSPLEIAPLQLFYGMVGFSKALVVASSLRPLSTLKPAHGLTDVSEPTSRIADLRLKIGGGGTFQEFNDVIAKLTRVCYMDFHASKNYSVYLPSAESTSLTESTLTLQEILSRIPLLESLYKMTFGADAQTAQVRIQAPHLGVRGFQIQVQDDAIFSDLGSLREIVGRWRHRFPCLRKWRVASASYNWDKTTVTFENLPGMAADEFSEGNSTHKNSTFEAAASSKYDGERFSLTEGLDSIGSYLQGGTHLISPVGNTNISEFSLHYLGLFLLSSLVRYRPQIWAHSISRSVMAGKPADDRILSLIEKFLDLNRNTIPELIVGVLNPNEDYFSTFDDAPDARSVPADSSREQRA